MKKRLSLIPLILALIVLAASVVECFYGIYEINLTLDTITNTPGSSGVDYLGVDWGYCTALFAASAFGLVLSIVSTKLLKQKVLRSLSVASISLFALLMIHSILYLYAS